MKKIPFNITFIKLALVSVLLQYMFLVFLIYKRRIFSGGLIRISVVNLFVAKYIAGMIFIPNQ